MTNNDKFCLYYSDNINENNIYKKYYSYSLSEENQIIFFLKRSLNYRRTLCTFEVKA